MSHVERLPPLYMTHTNDYNDYNKPPQGYKFVTARTTFVETGEHDGGISDIKFAIPETCNWAGTGHCGFGEKVAKFSPALPHGTLKWDNVEGGDGKKRAAWTPLSE